MNIGMAQKRDVTGPKKIGHFCIKSSQRGNHFEPFPCGITCPVGYNILTPTHPALQTKKFGLFGCEPVMSAQSAA
jgi:hypothetical protein